MARRERWAQTLTLLFYGGVCPTFSRPRFDLDRNVNLQVLGELLATHPKLKRVIKRDKRTHGRVDPPGQHLRVFWLKV